jgi:hypothetical protein
VRADAVLLGLLVATDLAFIAVHLVHVSTGYLSNPLNSLERDRGYAEFFQYTKLYWLVLLTGLLAFKHRALIHVGWLVVLAYLLVDDVFFLHETFGAYAAAALGIGSALGLRADDLGELIVTAIAGTTAVTVLGLGYWRSGNAGRTLSRSLFGLLAALAFFGVVVDMIREGLRETFVGTGLGLIEDGGEMLVVSLMVWTVVRYVALQHAAGDPRATSLESPPASSRTVPRAADHAP